jgi:hypothetical protein
VSEFSNNIVKKFKRSIRAALPLAKTPRPRTGWIRALRAGAAALLIATVCCSSIWADNWSDAKNRAEAFIDHYEALRQLYPDEIKKIVSLLCKFEDDDHASLYSEVRDRVKSESRDKVDAFKAMLDESNELLDKVIANDDFKGNRSDAKALRKRTNELFDRVDRMTESVRGGNNPVFAFMREAGQKAHKEYQNTSSYCDVPEFETGDGPADCLYARECWVIEVKSANDESVQKGRARARDYANALNTDKDGKFNDLVKAKSAFSGCARHFAPKLVSYSLCPDVSDDGEVKSTAYVFTKPEN